MKNIFKFILALSLFIATLYAENINECKIDIYFGNGVWNQPEEAEEGRKKLQTYIIDKEIIKNDPELQAKYGEAKLQHNWSYGDMMDLLETFYQLKETGQIGEEHFFYLCRLSC